MLEDLIEVFVVAVIFGIIYGAFEWQNRRYERMMQEMVKAVEQQVTRLRVTLEEHSR